MNPPFSLSTPRQLACRDRSLSLGKGTVLVGILNLTTDSFYDGGRFTGFDAAMTQAERLVAEGASVIDIGGQSTRPGYQEISVAEEIAKVVPVIEALVKRVTIPLSIDTYKPEVARAALVAGAHILNDIHGLQGAAELARLAAEFGCPVIVMHLDAGFKEFAGDTMEKMKAFFGRSLEIAMQAGVPLENLILDPGIGFAKTHEQNLEILARLSELKTLGCPLLLGASRKSVIGNVLALSPDERLEGTLATTALAVWQGVDFLRVHDVQANARVVKMIEAIRHFAHS